MKRPTRVRRELKTIQAMVHMYCRDLHKPRHGTLCEDCRELLHYAGERLVGCPFQDKKPTCATCPIHCYKPVMREKIRAVMRYAGPRMLLRHPVLAMTHKLDGVRRKRS